MHGSLLTQIALFLAAAAIAAPLAKRLQIGSVLGYLAAGILIGPFGLGLIYSIYDVKNVLHFGEFGVVMLLFLIGLELKPARLWTMRTSVFGFGGAQVLITTVALAAASLLLGYPWQTALFIGLALSLSSTAFALQVLEEKKELTDQHGRTAFSILLFQDLAAIPMLALVPLFALAPDASGAMSTQETLLSAGKAIGIVIGVIVVGRFVLRHVYRLVAATGVKEAMTASALLTVVGVALLMELAGLSPALGAFLAGALLADSEYRHEMEANIAPFEGLLLGLFFIAIGMSLDLKLLAQKPIVLIGAAVAIVAIKAAILYAIGRAAKLNNRGAQRLAIAISQDGEFGFVLLTSAAAVGAITSTLSDQIAVIITITMIMTPLLLLAHDKLSPRHKVTEADAYDDMAEDHGGVVIAGFGRFGQITARILAARGIPFTALDKSSTHVDFVRKFGSKIYYGDPARIDILRAAGTEKARAFVLAMNDQDETNRVAGIVRKNFPHVPIFARARDRAHVHQLMDLGVKVIRRETFGSALSLTREVLTELGFSSAEAKAMIKRFRIHDRQRLYDDYEHAGDIEKLQQRARDAANELEELFEQDEEIGSAIAVATDKRIKEPV